MKDNTAMDTIRNEGFPVDVAPEGVTEIDWMLDLAGVYQPTAWLLDVRTGLTPHSVLRLRATNTLVVALDDGTARRLMADASFYPPVPQVFGLDWSLAEREPNVGWEWVALGQDNLPPRTQNAGTPHILVSMGGSDPHGLTLPAVQVLASIRRNLKVTVIIGPSVSADAEAAIRREAPVFTVVRNPENMGDIMATADVALVTFGVTAYELAAMGVPAIYICLNEDHAESASAFVRAGMGVSLGLAALLEPHDMSDSVVDLLDDPDLCRSMSAAGRMNLDGRGATRIASAMARLVQERAEALTTSTTLRVAVA
jgi:spore coat polysaccharide biosynthesis protein SpsF